MTKLAMNKLPSILLVSILALTSGGCGLFQGTEETTQTPEPTPTSPESATPPPSKKAFEEPNPPTQSLVTVPSEGLIQSTTPSERRQEIQSGSRTNPFAVLPVQPKITKKVAKNGVADPKRQCVVETPKPETTVAQAPQTAVEVKTTTKPPEPVLPIPNEARGVFVSGVVQIGASPVAIVQAPGESVARQVRAGATLANGQVLVKAVRIDGGKPYVLLHQYGLEIPRYVGQPPEEPVAPPPPPSPVGESTTGTGTATATAAKAPAPVIAPPGPNGFGKIRNLVLLSLNIGNAVLGESGQSRRSGMAATGILCNDGYSPIKVSKLLLQVEDKGTGAVIDSFEIALGSSYTISPAQKAEFDGGIPKLRGRKRGDVNIKLVGWS